MELEQRHCEPTGRSNARPMTGSAKQSRAAKKDWIASSLTLLAMTAFSWSSPRKRGPITPGAHGVRHDGATRMSNIARNIDDTAYGSLLLQGRR
jgi:hypothetical protein